MSIHSSTSNLDRIRDSVAETAQKALEAWETFPDKVPYQTAGGWIVPENEYLQPPEFQGGAC